MIVGGKRTGTPAGHLTGCVKTRAQVPISQWAAGKDTRRTRTDERCRQSFEAPSKQVAMAPKKKPAHGRKAKGVMQGALQNGYSFLPHQSHH